jgi:hypothetical protein
MKWRANYRIFNPKASYNVLTRPALQKPLQSAWVYSFISLAKQPDHAINLKPSFGSSFILDHP